MSIQCLAHSPGEFIAIRDDFLAICDDNHAAAALLQRFEFWTNGLLKWELAKHGENTSYAELDLWLTHSIADLVAGLRGLFGRNKVIAARDQLIKSGFLSKRLPYKDKWRQKYQYRLDIDKVQAALNSLATAAAAPKTDPPARNLNQDARCLNSNNYGLEHNAICLDSNNAPSDSLSQNKHATLEKESPKEESLKESSLESLDANGKDNNDNGNTNLSIEKIIEFFVAEQVIAADSPMNKRSVQKLCETYGLETVLDTLEIAAKHQIRNLPYIEKILINEAEKAERARSHAATQEQRTYAAYQQQPEPPEPKIVVPDYEILKHWEGSKLDRRSDAALFICKQFAKEYPDHEETPRINAAIQTFNEARTAEINEKLEREEQANIAKFVAQAIAHLAERINYDRTGSQFRAYENLVIQLQRYPDADWAEAARQIINDFRERWNAGSKAAAYRR